MSPDSARREDLLEILDDRYQKRSTIVTSQLPVAHWHDHLQDKTFADAILDRLVHNSTRIELTGVYKRIFHKYLSTAFSLLTAA